MIEIINKMVIVASSWLFIILVQIGLCVNDSSRAELSSGRISEHFQFEEGFLPFTGEAFCLSVCLPEALDVQENASNSSACCFVWVWS